MTFPIQIEECVKLKELLNQFEPHHRRFVEATRRLPSDAGSDAFITLVLSHWKYEWAQLRGGDQKRLFTFIQRH